MLSFSLCNGVQNFSFEFHTNFMFHLIRNLHRLYVNRAIIDECID